MINKDLVYTFKITSQKLLNFPIDRESIKVYTITPNLSTHPEPNLNLIFHKFNLFNDQKPPELIPYLVYVVQD
jgi:hypothetical protein